MITSSFEILNRNLLQRNAVQIKNAPDKNIQILYLGIECLIAWDAKGIISGRLLRGVVGVVLLVILVQLLVSTSSPALILAACAQERRLMRV